MPTKNERNDSVIQSAGSVPAIASIDAIALYDPRDGRVVHMHHVITFEGAKRRNVKEQERNAMESARRLGCGVDGLNVLHVPNFQPTSKAFQVDLEKQVLIEAPLMLRKDGRQVSGAGL